MRLTQWPKWHGCQKHPIGQLEKDHECRCEEHAELAQFQKPNLQLVVEAVDVVLGGASVLAGVRCCRIAGEDEDKSGCQVVRAVVWWFPHVLEMSFLPPIGPPRTTKGGPSLPKASEGRTHTAFHWD